MKIKRRWYCLSCGKLNHRNRARCKKCGDDSYTFALLDEFQKEASGVIIEAWEQIWKHPKLVSELKMPCIRVLKPTKYDRENAPDGKWQKIKL